MCYFLHHTHTPWKLKVRFIDPNLLRKLLKACTTEAWANAIDGEYDALLERIIWTYIKKMNDRITIPFVWDSRIKDTDKQDLEILGI